MNVVVAKVIAKHALLVGAFSAAAVVLRDVIVLAKKV